MNRLLSFSLCVLGIIGCVPVSDHPLTLPGDQKLETSLIGTWWGGDGGEISYVHIGQRETSEKYLHVLCVQIDKNGSLERMEFSGHISSVAGNTYLNLTEINNQGEMNTDYLFVKYQQSGDTCHFALMNQKVTRQAIEKGRLRGKVKSNLWSSSVRITEGSEKLRQFVLDRDKELFEEHVRLDRLDRQK